MKHKFSRILPILLLHLLLTGCGYAGPEKAVCQELDLIQELDESTIKAFVSYEDIHLSGDSTEQIGTETIEAVKLFFQNFKYRIKSSSMSADGSNATVTVNITNLDAEALAKDLCRAIIRQSLDYGSSSPEEQNSLVCSFALMKECLEANTYESRTTSVTFHLVNQNDLWIIQENQELEDQIAGGLAAYLSDPYLLEPSEVLDITLEPFREFTADEWLAYLNIENIFAVENELSSQLDEALVEQLASYFDYKVANVTQDGNTASAEVEVTSFDLESVVSQCRSELLAYAQTTESIRATEEELSLKTAEILLEALTDNSATVTRTLIVTLSNNGSIWEANLNASFTDALLGGITDAVSILYPAEDTAAYDAENDATYDAQSDAAYVTESDPESGV